MWRGVCGKTARMVLGEVYFECYVKREVNLFMNIFVISDNVDFLCAFFQIVNTGYEEHNFQYYCSSDSYTEFCEFCLADNTKTPKVKPIRLQEQSFEFYNKYDLYLSLHRKQIFPMTYINEFSR